MALLSPIGSKFKIATAGGSPAEVGEVVSISGPSPSVEALDTSALDDSFATRIAGRTDWGSITITVNVSEDPTVFKFSTLAALGGTAVDWEITIPCSECSADPMVISGSDAICGQVGLNIASGSVVQATVELQLSGDVTVTVS
jgi:hypothetical protein